MKVTMGAFPKLRAWCEKGAARGWHETAAVAVSVGDEVVAEAWPADGTREVSAATAFPLTCLSKPIAATAVGVAAQEGLLDVCRPVGHYVPAFRGGRARDHVTVLHLLTHTAMLAADPAPLPWQAELSRSRVLSLDVAPGSWPGASAAFSAYANWFLLGEVLAAVGGTTATAFVTEAVLRPFGLDDAIDLAPQPGRHEVVPLDLDGAPNHVGAECFAGWVEGLDDWCGLTGVASPAAVARFFRAMMSAVAGEGTPILDATHAGALVSPWRRGLRDLARGDTLTWGLGYVVDARPFGGRCSPRTFSHTGWLASSLAFGDPAGNVAGAVFWDRAVGGAPGMMRLAGGVSALFKDLRNA